MNERARSFFEGRNFAHLATIGPDGVPHLTVIWADVEDDGKIGINSAEGRAWPANVRRDPRVTLTVTDHDDPYKYVEIRGQVVEDTHDGADEHIDSLAKKYMDEDTYPFRKNGEQRIKFLIEPDRVRVQG